ncbi:MAG: hypothetical protein HEQ37_18595 [Acidovorax sp.]|nr:hypothetical protein [Acidovorax sp.]
MQRVLKGLNATQKIAASAYATSASSYFLWIFDSRLLIPHIRIGPFTLNSSRPAKGFAKRRAENHCTSEMAPADLWGL